MIFKYISDQLGHGSIQVTADLYGHLEPGANRDFVDRLDGEVFQQSGNNLETNQFDRGAGNA